MQLGGRSYVIILSERCESALTLVIPLSTSVSLKVHWIGFWVCYVLTVREVNIFSCSQTAIFAFEISQGMPDFSHDYIRILA